MRADLRAVCDLEEGLVRQWRELADRALEPNPFYAPQMAAAAARFLPGGRDDLLLTVHRGQELVLALPLRRVAAFRRVPLPAYLAWGHRHSYLDTVLVDPGDPVGALSAGVGALQGRGPAWLVLPHAGGDGPVREALDAALAERDLPAHGVLRQERPMVRRRAGGSYVVDRLSTSRQKRLRRQRRALAAEVGPLTTEDLAALDVDEGMARFLALEAAGWKGRAGTALASSPQDAQFFRAAMRAFAADGGAQVWSLSAGGMTVATMCTVAVGGSMFQLKTAYDERHARHSPGVLLELDVLDEFHRDPSLQWIDSCTSSDPSPSSLLFPDRRPVETLLVSLGGVRGSVALAGLRLGLHGRRLVRRSRSSGS